MSVLAPPPANDNADPYGTATGAYFQLLQARAEFLRRAPSLTAAELERLQPALRRVEAAMRKMEPNLPR